jgi:hypothetical protein
MEEVAEKEAGKASRTPAEERKETKEKAARRERKAKEKGPAGTRK